MELCELIKNKPIRSGYKDEKFLVKTKQIQSSRRLLQKALDRC
jgi:hypothetical protein